MESGMGQQERRTWPEPGAVRPVSSMRRPILQAPGKSNPEPEPICRFCHVFTVVWGSIPCPVIQIVVLLSWAVAVTILNNEGLLDAGLRLESTAGVSIQTILSFLIVFRTNQSYNRWWEARILWGKMLGSCVELAQQAATWIDNTQLAVRITDFAIVYAYTVKQVLRREPLFAVDLDGIINAEEVNRINKLSDRVKPYYSTEVMRQCTKKGLTENPQTFGPNAVARGIDVPVAQLSLQYVDMVRVRNTPQPVCFRILLHVFTILYLLLLPLISYDALGYLVIPEVLLTSYLMLSLQIAADHLENPFGRDEYDHDLDKFVREIASQCREALYIGEKSELNLTVPP